MPERWNKSAKSIAYKATFAKFSQNMALKQMLVNSGNQLIVEASTNSFWGTGIHLHDKNALDKRAWVNKEGGAMSDILGCVRRDLSK